MAKGEKETNDQKLAKASLVGPPFGVVNLLVIKAKDALADIENEAAKERCFIKIEADLD